MKLVNKIGKAWLGLATAFLITASVSPSWGVAQNSSTEGKCQESLTKAIGKHAAAVSKAMATCTGQFLASDIAGPCPDTKAQEAIAKAAAKALKVGAKCQSQCSLSKVPCIGALSCPPNGNVAEGCIVSGKEFQSTNMFFPGPFCASIIGHDMANPEDFGLCSAGLESLSDFFLCLNS